MSTHTEISPGPSASSRARLTRRPERLLAREQLADGALRGRVPRRRGAARAGSPPADRHLAAGPRDRRSSLAYALVGRAEFPSGAGFAVPTQVVFVPMLLLLPTPIVPLLVALALVLTSTANALRGRLARDRVLLSLADAWLRARRPRSCSSLGGAQTPDWGDWPIYVAALAASRSSSTRALFVVRVLGVPRRSRRASSSPSCGWPIASTCCSRRSGSWPRSPPSTSPTPRCSSCRWPGSSRSSPRERTARVEQTLELSGAYRGTALLLGDVIEADDAYTGQHTQDVVELTVTVADRLGRRRGDPPRGRVRRAAARRRQGRDPERDHQQARARSTTRSGRS